MLFNAIDFLFFFPIVTIAYFVFPHKYRCLLLLLVRCFFYMFFIPYYILFLFVTITIDYFAGIYIERSVGARRKLYLSFSIFSLCGFLFIFKYFYFVDTNLSVIA